MDIALVIIFMLLGIMFFILEIFFLPGVTIGGFAGTIFTIAGVWYSFAKLGNTAGWLTIGLGVVVFLILLWIFIKSKTLEKVSLKKDLGTAESPYNMDKVKVGDKGITLSRLAPMGKVLVNEEEYEAKSRDILINENMNVEVISIEGQTLIVRTI